MESARFVVAAVLLLFAGAAIADPVPFKDCGSVSGTLTTVDVAGCTAFPCPLIKGTNITFEIDFTSKVVTTNATSFVYGIIAGVPVPFPLPNANGCIDSGIVCPTQVGTAYKYKNSLPILDAYPEIQLVVKWLMVDDAGNDLFCWLVPVKIVSS